MFFRVAGCQGKGPPRVRLASISCLDLAHMQILVHMPGVLVLVTM